MPGLMMLLSGIVLAVLVEPAPKWVKTVVWVVLVVLGIVMGALAYFQVPGMK